MESQKQSDRLNKMEEVSDRIKKLRDRFISTTPRISVQRAEIITETYKKTIGIPFILRRAEALRNILEKIDIYIADGELIVGGLTEIIRGVPLFPEYDVEFILDELNTFDSRVADRFELSEENKGTLKKILPFWKGQTIKDNGMRLLPQYAKESALDMVNILTALKSGVGHMIVDYDYVLKNGLVNIIERLETVKESIDINDPEFSSKRDFCDSAVICLKATINFAHRFSRLARKQAFMIDDQKRKNELIKIADICMKVPAEPSENFWEACQSLWFIHLVLQLESNGHSVSLGRFDQYMYSYFERGVGEGFEKDTFTYDLIDCLWIKLSEINKVRDKVSSMAFGGYPVFQHLTLGGQDSNGTPSVNQLSHFCLEASARVGLTQPSISIRWHYGCPEDFLDHAVMVSSYGSGMPAFFNDEVLIPNMLQNGYPLEDARNYAIVGCTEPTVPGISEPWLTGGFISLPKILELTIYNGFDPVLKKQGPIQTGDVEKFVTFEQFQSAYFEQLNFYLRQSIICNNVLDGLHGELAPTPFEAAFIADCIDRCKTSLNGGARFNSSTINAVGIANAADSLAAIKKLIYEEGRLRWDELIAALKANFDGNEKLRQILINEVPKYGNDQPYVDNIGNSILDHLSKEISLYKNARQGRYLIALYSVSSHVLLADRVGALPDGRKHGMVLADGGVSCSQGMDKEGPTALLNSVVRLDPFKAIGSTLLNVKLHPNVFTDQKNIPKIASLIKTYFLNKGQHLQFNVIDTKTLREAQRHPERYPFLVVRVAGFSVLFATIDPRLQEDIIQRTAHLGN